MKHKRLWHPPGSFGAVPHWELQIQTITGQWVTYTEHETADEAHAHWDRFRQRHPSQASKVTAVGMSWADYTPVPCIIPLGFV
jgi:hypothetical protein